VYDYSDPVSPKAFQAPPDRPACHYCLYAGRCGFHLIGSVEA